MKTAQEIVEYMSFMLTYYEADVKELRDTDPLSLVFSTRITTYRQLIAFAKGE